MQAVTGTVWRVEGEPIDTPVDAQVVLLKPCNAEYHRVTGQSTHIKCDELHMQAGDECDGDLIDDVA